MRSVISEFLRVYVRDDARELDMKSLDTVPEGEQLDIYVFRESLVASANEELVGIEIDPRVPLSVHFYGEGEFSQADHSVIRL